MEIDRKAELESEKRQVLRIIKSRSTLKKSLLDYPPVEKYLQEKFPEIDITDISIYVTSPRVMRSCKSFKNCAGVYLPFMKTILMKSIVHMMGGSDKGLFNRLLSKEKIKTEVEDILVHEAMHAISGAANRSGRRYRVDEEEFAYTNCIDFYKQKGMSDVDIINKVYLPFCVCEVMERDLKKMCDSLPHSKDLKFDDKFLDKHASFLVPKVLEKARGMGFSMIELYNKWGRGITLSGPPINSAAKRIGSIDFEC